MEHPIFGFDAPSDPDRWVYHYTSLRSAAAIARSRTFRFSPQSRMNDPREFKKLTIPWMSTGVGLSQGKIAEVERHVNRRRLNVRLGAFTRDESAGSNSSMQRTEGRGYARPMMWAHYASRHRGVCFIFERDAVERAVKRKYGTSALVEEVEYPSLYPTPSSWTPLLEAAEVHAHGEQIAADCFFHQYKRELLFIKNPDWSVEREWRVAIDGQPKGVIVDISLSRSMVAGLVVGLQLPKSRLSLVQAVSASLNVSKNVAVAYQHQMNAIDVAPIDSSSSVWRFFSASELKSLGHTSVP